jgi:hypothetical protein
LLLDAELREILRAFAGRGVPVLLLKGPALARTIYPAAVLRPYTDIDLTIQEKHAQAAAGVLLACGFREVPSGAEVRRQAHAARGADASFHRRFMKGGALVELHVDPLQLGIRPRCEAARWQRAVGVPGLEGALMLCAEDQLVQLSVHAHKHGFDRLIWLKDLDRLLRFSARTFDWSLATAVSHDEGVGSSVWYGLYLARSLLEAPVGSMDGLSPPLPLRALYHLLWPPARIADLDGHMRRRAVQFHVADSWRGMLPTLVLMGRRSDRARALLRAVLP